MFFLIILYKKNCNNDLILDKIKQLLDYYPNLNVIKINNENIKCGYICDIQRMKILYNNNDEDEVIIKISNLDNSLSKTAIELDMYNNEIITQINIYNKKIADITKIYKNNPTLKNRLINIPTCFDQFNFRLGYQRVLSRSFVG